MITRQLRQLDRQAIPLPSRFSCCNRMSLNLLLKALKSSRQSLTRIKRLIQPGLEIEAPTPYHQGINNTSK